MDGVRGLGEDEHVGAQRLEQFEMRAQRLHLLVRRRGSAALPNTSPTRRPGRRARAPAFSASGSRGNLWPSSMPSKPACLGLGQAGFERRLAAELAHVVIRPADGVRADPDRHVRLPRLFSSVTHALQRERILVALARRVHLRARRDFRHRDVPPVAAGIGGRQRIGVDDDRRSCGRPCARSSARFQARRGRRPSRAIAPRLAAWAAKSIVGQRHVAACAASRLLKLSPPVARCRRLMQPKPRLSSTTMVSFRPSITEVAISEFIIR